MKLFLLIIFGCFLLYMFWGDIIPTKNDRTNSIEYNLSDFSEVESGIKTGFAYSTTYLILYSDKEKKYYVLLFFPQKRFQKFYPKVDTDEKQITVLINKEVLGNSKYGSKEKPIPILNYKIENEFVSDEKQYEYNIRRYLAYGKWINFK